MSELLKTPLNAVHRALGAKMVDFGGWDMPVQYPAGIIAEHVAVRTKVGLFDVSHMGEIRVKGPQAMAFLDWLTPNAVVKLAHGQIHYTAFLYENGTFVDDLLLHKIADDHFLLVVNASNVDKDFAWVKEHAAKWDVEVTNESDQTGQVALQGPLSIDVLQPLVDIDLSQIKYYWFAFGKFKGMPVMFARTGYTGEDGFEVYCPAEKTEWVWNELMQSGKPLGLAPTGLGCRNTLRLEAKMALYGHEIDDTTNALEADLGWIIKLNKGEFLGREALATLKEQGFSRRLVGFRMLEKREIARDHMDVLVDGKKAGYVTSGSPSTTCGFNLGLAYVPVSKAPLGSRIHIDIRGKACEAEVVPTPFYKRAK
ncbi:MAG: glycine cleavage system aminomethyltransferase GcvT [Holophaga sp.]|nr:glycine cleavage system aminomethyltransferase GcvT [Holophaga sp.]